MLEFLLTLLDSEGTSILHEFLRYCSFPHFRDALQRTFLRTRLTHKSHLFYYWSIARAALRTCSVLWRSAAEARRIVRNFSNRCFTRLPFPLGTSSTQDEPKKNFIGRIARRIPQVRLLSCHPSLLHRKAKEPTVISLQKWIW